MGLISKRVPLRKDLILVRDKHSSFIDPFVGYEENEVLCIQKNMAVINIVMKQASWSSLLVTSTLEPSLININKHSPSVKYLDYSHS